MHQPYSFWADLLNKFHTAPSWIQALWLLAGTACALPALHTLKAISVAILQCKGVSEVELIYGICRDHTGRLMVYPERKKALPMPTDWRDRIL